MEVLNPNGAIDTRYIQQFSLVFSLIIYIYAVYSGLLLAFDDIVENIVSLSRLAIELNTRVIAIPISSDGRFRFRKAPSLCVASRDRSPAMILSRATSGLNWIYVPFYFAFQIFVPIPDKSVGINNHKCKLRPDQWPNKSYGEANAEREVKRGGWRVETE